MKAKFSFMQRFSDFIISSAIKPQGQPMLDSFAKPDPQGKIAPFGRKAKSTKLQTFHLTGKPNSQNDRHPTLPQPTKIICQGSSPHLLFFNAQIKPPPSARLFTAARRFFPGPALLHCTELRKMPYIKNTANNPDLTIFPQITEKRLESRWKGIGLL